MSAPSPLATPLPWDLVADDYTAEVMPHFERYAAEALRLAELRPGQRVVDVCCGPGTLSLLAARAGARVSALDFSEPMLARLREQLGPDAAIEPIVGDGQELPYGEDSFDAGFSMFGLIFFPDRVRGLRELRRVVRDGGPVVVASWKPLDQVPALQVVFSALRAALPGLPFGGGPTPLGSPEQIFEETALAGLSRVEIHSFTHGSEYPSPADFWASMERTLAPLVLLKHRLGEDWPATSARIREGVLATLDDGPVRYDMPAWLTVARA